MRALAARAGSLLALVAALVAIVVGAPVVGTEPGLPANPSLPSWLVAYGYDAPVDIAPGRTAEPAVSEVRSLTSKRVTTVSERPAGDSYDDSRSLVAATAAGSNSYAYDAVGNQTTRSTSAVGSQTLAYDALNRMITITGDGPDLDVLYDSAGNRVRRQLDGDTVYYLGEGFELSTTPAIPRSAGDSVGAWNPTTHRFTLANNPATIATDQYSAPYGIDGDIALSGDWDGDGTDTPGIYRPSTRTFYLSNTLDGTTHVTATYGSSGDKPIVGDFDGNGTDTIGIYRPSTSRFYLTNNNTTTAIATTQWGSTAATYTPLAGDWNGDGTDTIGLHEAASRRFYLSNTTSPPATHLNIQYGNPGDFPITGDWNANGTDTPGLYRPSNRTHYLRSETGTTTTTTAWSTPANQPLTGNWPTASSTPAGGNTTIHHTLTGRTIAASTNTDLTITVADHLGTPTVTRNQWGNTTTQRHTPYGATRGAANPATNGHPTDRAYTDQSLDTGTGLYHYNARYYDPHLARFTQPDTILPGGGLSSQGNNRYTYVLGNPLRYNDPTGHCPQGGPHGQGECYDDPVYRSLSAGMRVRATTGTTTLAGDPMPTVTFEVFDDDRVVADLLYTGPGAWSHNPEVKITAYSREQIAFATVALLVGSTLPPPLSALHYAYDQADRPTNIWYAHSSGWKDVSQWSYDQPGSYGTLYQAQHWNRTSDGVSQGWVSEKHFYDDRYRLERVEQDLPVRPARDTIYEYLDSGAVTKIWHPNGQVTINSHDRMGRTQWIGIDNHTAVSWVSYNARGQIGAIQRGVDTWWNDLRTDYTYDARNGAIASADTQGHTGRLQRYDYTLTADMELTKIKETSIDGTNTLCATYDTVSRLTRAWTRGDGNCATSGSDWAGPEPFHSWYYYDPLGRITSSWGEGTPDGAYTYNSGHAHAPSAAAGNTYTYDPSGNRTRATIDGQTINSTYDVQGRLTATTGTADSEHLYNTSGERVVRTVDGDTTWYYQGGYEENEAWQSTVSISLNGQLVATWVTETGQLWSQASDHLGTPTLARSWSDHTETRRTTAYGSPRTPASTVDGGPSDLSYTGQRDDPATGLMYYGARYYDPTLGQFTQPDTITLDGPNRYQYVRSNPLRYADPTGLCAEEVAKQGGCYQWALLEIGTTMRGPLGDSRNMANEAYGRYSNISPSPAVADLAGAGLGMAAAASVKAGAKTAADNPNIFKKAVNALTSLFKQSDQAPNGLADDLARGLCSFSGETEVLMADGRTKPISEVEIGDEVLAVDPETGVRGPRQVTHLWVHQDTIVNLEIEGHDVATTEDHPFWNHTDSEWQRADALDPDDLVLTAAGELLTVSGIDWGSARTTTAYNLTVDDIHTYFVEVGGDESVLVHNTCGLSPNQMNRAIHRGQAPRGITRIDTPKVKGEQLHATFDGGAALNVDGTWKHGFVDLTRRQRQWLRDNGWNV